MEVEVKTHLEYRSLVSPR